MSKILDAMRKASRGGSPGDYRYQLETIEGGNLFFQYPPTLRTLQLTLREVRNCTQKGIVINTFMLESGRLRGAIALAPFSSTRP